LITVQEKVMSASTPDGPSAYDDAQHQQRDRPGKPETNGDASVLRGLRESARVTGDAFCAAGQKASAAIQELSDGAVQIGSRTGARVARQVEAQPMAAAVVAASLGLIIGVLLPRR
jgi:ElaB/YqjD/DUF883 family membrane-anchored ribosome-binding protein